MVCAGEHEYCHLADVSGLSVEPDNCGLGPVLFFLGLPSHSGRYLPFDYRHTIKPPRR